MAKHLHAVQIDGTTFGMELKTDTRAWRKFKAAVKIEPYISILGDESRCIAVPYMALAACMEKAHWLVSEYKSFNYIIIDGFFNNAKIYVKYEDGIRDFRDRK